jgi:hypothetical protein
VVVGIDIATDRLNWLALDDDGAFIDGDVCTADDLARLSRLADRADVIAIDAPAQLSTAPHDQPEHKDEHLSKKFLRARCAEIALGRTHRIWVPWVGPDVVPTRGWIATGLNLYSRLAASSDAELIEVFPHAAFRVLRQPMRLERKTSVAGIHQRVDALREVGLKGERVSLWSHDSVDAAVAAIVARDRLRRTAVRVTCGHDSSALWLPEAAMSRPLVKPKWPSERFFLAAIPDGWTVGPFDRDDWTVMDDGSLLYADGIIHPITLRVHAQDGSVLHANNGDVSDMSYEMVPVSIAPPAWLVG